MGLPSAGCKDELGGLDGAVDKFNMRLEEKMRPEAAKEAEIVRCEKAEREGRALREAGQTRIFAKVVAVACSLFTGIRVPVNR